VAERVAASFVETRDQLARGELSSVELVNRCLGRIEAYDEAIGSLLTVQRDTALTRAADVDVRRQNGRPLGRLAGMPIIVKDNICQADVRTTCGSRMLEDFVPPYDAHVITRLLAEDAILLGRSNLDEFAMGSSCEHSAMQVTRNPWDRARIAGGSSGGSAAAVASGFVPLALGSDTGGSIRQPAALCGIVGLKPTYGRVSRYGLVAFGSSLDQIGPMSCDVSGAAALLEAIAGHDPRDTTSADRPVPSYTARLEEPLQGLRIGVVPEHFGPGIDPEVAAAVQEAIEVYRGLGAEIQEVELPHSKYSVAVYYIVAPCEASSNLARYDGVHYGRRAEQFDGLVDLYVRSRSEGFGDEVKRRIMLGTYALSSGYYDAYYLKALKVRRLISRDYDAAFEKVDLLIGPVAPSTAYPIGSMAEDPLAVYLQDIYTIGANLAGLPGISIPCGLSAAGLPVGVQLTAPVFEEERLLRAARMFERETDWHQRRPSMTAANGDGE